MIELGMTRRKNPLLAPDDPFYLCSSHITHKLSILNAEQEVQMVVEHEMCEEM